MIRSTSHLRLLIVHRDEAAGRRLEELARQSGLFAPLVTMTDGRFALEYLWQSILGEERAAIPDVVIASLQIGGLNGVQLTRELRRYDETRNLFIAIISATGGPLDQDAAENAGCDFFVKRPDSPAALAKIVTSIAHRCVAKASPPWIHTARLWHSSLSGSGLDVSNDDMRMLRDLRTRPTAEPRLALQPESAGQPSQPAS